MVQCVYACDSRRVAALVLGSKGKAHHSIFMAVEHSHGGHFFGDCRSVLFSRTWPTRRTRLYGFDHSPLKCGDLVCLGNPGVEGTWAQGKSACSARDSCWPRMHELVKSFSEQNAQLQSRVNTII